MNDLCHHLSELPGGLRVASAVIPHVETVAVGVWVAAGTRDETAEVAGVAHLLEHMAFKGTARRSAREIAETIESVGGSLDAHTSREYTAYYARVLAGDLHLALDLIADILQHSLFEEVELERERQVVLQEIAEVNDTPDELVFDLLQEAAFPDQGLGWPILGRPETVARMEREALFAFLRRHYRAPRLVVAAAGKVAHERLLEAARGLFGEILPEDGTHVRARARYLGGERRVRRPTDQLHVLLGFPGVSLSDPLFYAQHVFANVLGGGMASRLFQEVRERRALAYTVFAHASAYSDCGLLSLYASTDPGRGSELLFVMAEELRRLVLDGACEEELRRARRQVEASLLMSLESCGAVCEDMARQVLFFGRRLPVPEIMERIEAVDAGQLREVGERFLDPLRPALAVVGPDDAFPGLEELEARLR